MLNWCFPCLETESIGKVHISLAQQLIEELELCVRKFREMQRDKRKNVRFANYIIVLYLQFCVYIYVQQLPSVRCIVTHIVKFIIADNSMSHGKDHYNTT